MAHAMSPLPPLPIDIRQALDKALNGEPVLWAARPDGKRQRIAFLIWLFAIPWTVFALFWESMALMPWWASTNAPPGIAWTFGIAMPIFGIPFIVIGLWMMWMPFAAIRKAPNTIYALTEKRLVSLVMGKKTEVRSVPMAGARQITRTEGEDGWGNLSIVVHSLVDSDGDRVTEKFEMIGIPDVAGLERRILELQST